MAIVENPIIGRARKQLGNVVFYTLYDQNIIRSKPLSSKNPKTPDQRRVRKRFTKVTRLLRQVTVPIKTAYAGSVKGKSAFSQVMSINLKNCFIGNSINIDPSRFELCENDGSFVDNVVLASSMKNTITVTFNANAQNQEEEDDDIRVYGFDAKHNKIWQFWEKAKRSSGAITVSHSGMSGLDIAVYIESLDKVDLLMEMPKHVIKYVGRVRVV